MPSESDAGRLARFLASGDRASVNIRADILRAEGSPVRDPKAVATVLEELFQRNVARPVVRAKGQLGRTPKLVELNPVLFAWAKKLRGEAAR